MSSSSANGPKGKVLVTGATGYIASHIIFGLIHRGFNVRGTVRNAKDKESWAFLKDIANAARDGGCGMLEVVQAKLIGDSPSHWASVVEGCTYVIHTASPVDLFGMSEEELVSQAVEGTECVMNGVAAGLNGPHPVKKVVLTSSVNAIIYGHSEERIAEGPLTEKDWSVEEASHGYTLSKLRAERLAWELAEKFDIKLDVICPGLVFGPILAKRHMNTHSSKMIKSLMLNEGWVSTSATVPLADVRDVAEMHITAATKQPECHGRRFICCVPSNGSKVYEPSMKRAARVLRDLLVETSHYHAPRLCVPNGVVKFMAKVYPKLGYWLELESRCSPEASLKTLDMGLRPFPAMFEDHAKSLFQFGLPARFFPSSEIERCDAYEGVPLRKFSGYLKPIGYS